MKVGDENDDEDFNLANDMARFQAPLSKYAALEDEEEEGKELMFQLIIGTCLQVSFCLCHSTSNFAREEKKKERAMVLSSK